MIKNLVKLDIVHFAFEAFQWIRVAFLILISSLRGRRAKGILLGCFLGPAVKHLSSPDFFECCGRGTLIKQMATGNKSFTLTRVFV